MVSPWVSQAEHKTTAAAFFFCYYCAITVLATEPWLVSIKNAVCSIWGEIKPKKRKKKIATKSEKKSRPLESGVETKTSLTKTSFLCDSRYLVYLELLHFVLQLRLFLHHVSSLRVQAGLHLPPQLLHFAQHLCPVQVSIVRSLPEHMSNGNSEETHTHTHTDLSISTSVRSSDTQLCCDWSCERRVWPQPFGHSLRKVHSDRWASSPRLSTCTGQPGRVWAERETNTQPLDDAIKASSFSH